jgi:hypothetical protein
MPAMNAFAQDTSPNGTAPEPQALDKPAGEAAPRGERDPDRLERQLDRLERLADMALQLGEGLIRKAARIETEGGEGYEAVCLAFTRLGRAVRQINFQEQEILGLRDTAEREARDARQAREKAAQQAKTDAKKREKHIVYQTVRELLAADRDMRFAGFDELESKLDEDYDDYYDLYRGSFEEIIARICRDLGIDAAPAEGAMTDDPEIAALGPANTPIGARQRIEAAVARIQSLQGTGPP